MNRLFESFSELDCELVERSERGKRPGRRLWTWLVRALRGAVCR